MTIEVQHIRKQFGQFTALDDVSLQFPDGELTALLGPSGCGKTTLLRIIAGLEYPDSGSVLLDGQDSSHRHVRERQVGFVFQHYALFKHMTVFENVAFGLRVKPRKDRPSESQIREKVKKLLELVQLDWIADRYPPQLSGGQRQRIALARALHGNPSLVVLDEPNSNLDDQGEAALVQAVRTLKERGKTVILVTHRMSILQAVDQLVVMRDGAVQGQGSRDDVLRALQSQNAPTAPSLSTRAG